MNGLRDRRSVRHDFKQRVFETFFFLIESYVRRRLAERYVRCLARRKLLNETRISRRVCIIHVYTKME